MLWTNSGIPQAVSGTVTYPITGSLPVMAQRSSARPVWHRSGSHPASNARLRPAFHQPGHDAARAFGVPDQVQHPERHDRRRLPEIEHIRRPAQNHPEIT